MVPTWTMSSIGSLRERKPGGGELDQREVELDEGVADVRVVVGALLQREPGEEA
ncbi:hypothetical protein STANM309S_03588 [Streptomyces tanashiensis]